MSSKISFILLSLILVISQKVSACDINGKTGIVAENKLYIPAGLKILGGINKTQFNNVIDRVESIYKSQVEKLGAKLSFERNWDDGTVNAYAHRDDQSGKIWFVSLFGGLARHPQMTEDAFAVVACHELGHHLGGAPKKKDSDGNSRWASNEGQADYYATLKCLRNYFKGLNNQEIVAKLNIPSLVTKSCQKSFANAEEIAVCQRSSMAGLDLGNFFKVLMNTKIAVNFNTPDTTKVLKTDDNHPQAQCRLDTYFQGSLCDKNVNEDLSDTDVNIGSCTQRNGDVMGLRPNCWFSTSETN